MRAIFIRHGQSTGSAGIPSHNLALLKMIELGWRQSREVAESWTETPRSDRHLTLSPHPADRRHRPVPNVPVEVWPIQEFIYLQPSRWYGTLSSKRMPYIERY